MNILLNAFVVCLVIILSPLLLLVKLLISSRECAVELYEEYNNWKSKKAAREIINRYENS